MSLKPWWDYPGQDDPKYANVPPPESLETSTAEQALDKDHLAAYLRAVTNVLSTELAESTFAQLVDGLPLWDVVYALDHYGLEENEPVYKHRTLCPGVLEKTRAFREAFDPARLEIRADVNTRQTYHHLFRHSNVLHQVLHRYQSIPVGSRASKLPFIELVAVAVHTTAAHLFKEVDGGLHQNEKYPSDEYYKAYSWRRRKPTPFSLWRYDDPEQYPEGNADIAAYWAEDQIFGGIILFDRGETGTEVGKFSFRGFWRLVEQHAWAATDDFLAKRCLVSLLSSWDYRPRIRFERRADRISTHFP